MPRFAARVLPILFTLTPLCAQGVTGGLQIGLSIPQGDAQQLVGSSPGLMIGGYARVPLSHGIVLRPGLAYRSNRGTSTPDGSQPYGYGTFENEIDTVNLGMDCLFHFAGTSTGPYGVLGLGAAHTSLRSDGGTSLLSSGSSTTEATAMSWTAGFGYDITGHVGLEFTYQSSSPSVETYSLSNGYSSGFNNSALSLALTLTF